MPDTQNPGIGQRIAALRQELRRRGLDAFILPHFDAYQGEYIAAHDARLAYITGFSGSAGMAIVTRDTVALFVDGRYQVQAREECTGPLFSHHHLFEDPPEHWLAGHAEQIAKVGFDPMHLPPGWFDRFATALAPAGRILTPAADNPVDAIWHDQPARPMGRIETMPLQLAGQAASDKIAALTATMDKQGAQVLVETQPDNIAWCLNVRGSDVAFNPVPQSFMMVDNSGAVTWFVAAAKLTQDVRDALPDSVTLMPQDRFLDTISERAGDGVPVLIDPDFSPVAVRAALQAAGATVMTGTSPLTLAKTHKNRIELEGLRACHLQDGVAMTEFSAWLAETVPARAAAGNPLTEREAEEKARAFRQARPGFLGHSFNPISAAAGNAAMCHYATTARRNAPVLPQGPYLLDSGGQYETGTTDITRSYAFGQRPDGYDRAYTAVFKAFHALATLRFPAGTLGHHIDAICRRPLWDLGLDYDHGTGHGVGHRLSVHEHPVRIGQQVSNTDLAPGMVLSIEPGHYVPDRYGVRIENLFEIVEADDRFLAFRSLTFVPIQTDMLITKALSDAERGWLDTYHAETERQLHPFLSDRALAWCRANRIA